MSENHSGMRRRARRVERARNFSAIREPLASDENESFLDLTDEEGRFQKADFESNERFEDGYASNETVEEMPTSSHEEGTVDFSAYYRRQSAEGDETAEPSFAPPPKLNYLIDRQEEPKESEETEARWRNIYRPREATWAETARHDVLDAEGIAYQVREETSKRRGRGKLRAALIVVAILVTLCAAGWLLREPLADLIAQMTGTSEPTEAPFEAITTPEPVKAYDAAPAAELAESARSAIGELSGTLNMEAYIVTDSHVVARNLRPDGLYDFYLFTAEGRLLCYFDSLGALDMIPQEDGVFYVKQSPWLVASNGTALIRTTEMEATEGMMLHPLYRGWSVIEDEKNGSANYINTGGQMISTLWFSKTFPFTGSYTAAYVDTGATADSDQRYLLYVLGEDGTMSRWLATADMDDAVAVALGMAYMRTGEVYRLPDTASVLTTTDHIDAYLDCDAMVVRDPQSGKYGLFVHGEQHYDFVYDSIAPVVSDITWAERTLSGEGGDFVVHAVEGASYPQPLAYSFALEKDGQCEYVALSTQSSYPIRLDGEF